MLQSKYYKLLPALALAAFRLATAHPAAASTAPLLPVLNWQQRSDWVNVKTDVRPAAFGDGVHDDTAAIQAALNRLDDNYVSQRKIVYFPPGTYRITKTLSLSKISGASLLGHGRTTRIVWNGPLNQVMFWSNGSAWARYRGLIWDGANRASVGVDHASKSYYETRVRHQDEEFINFRNAGIRVGYNQVLPTAEVMYRNCLFQKCGNGVTFLQWNDYNNDFEGCDFRDCGIAINCQIGEVYVRDSHFERSSEEDIFLNSHSHSIRRCTSVGSKQFLNVPLTGGSDEVTVQDCHVDGWTGPQGAMTFGMRGPTTVFDCSFTHPPDAAPPIRLTNYSTVSQSVTLSNNVAPASKTLLDPGPAAQIVQIPSGARGPSLSDPTKTLFVSSQDVPATILDVKTQFGAKGDGYTDDTRAVLSAIHAAAAQGGHPLVYLPPGVYNVSATLPMTGAYSIGGSGDRTIIHWSGGAATGPVFSVRDPQDAALEQMRINARDSVACIQQTSAGTAPSTMTYDGIDVSGSALGLVQPGGEGIVGSPRVNRGLECIGLPASAVVHLLDFSGSTHFTDCSRATILQDFGEGGVLLADGSRYEKSGFLGVLMKANGGTPCDNVIRDNQDFVATNMYTESTTSFLSASGDGAYPGQPGHVSVQATECNTFIPQAVSIDDYEGRVTLTGAHFTHQYQAGHSFAQTGSRPVDLLLLGNMFFVDEPTLNVDPGAGLTVLQNIVVNDKDNSATHTVPNQVLAPNTASTPDSMQTNTAPPARAGALADAAAALDDFRLLGEVDLAINHP